MINISRKRVVWALALGVALFARDSVNSQVTRDNKKIPDSCGYIMATLDGSAEAYKRLKNSKSIIVILAGSPATLSHRFDLERIDQAVRYFSKTHGIDSVEYGIGLASGPGLSYLRLIVGGELVGEIHVKPTGRLCRALSEPL